MVSVCTSHQSSCVQEDSRSKENSAGKQDAVVVTVLKQWQVTCKTYITVRVTYTCLPTCVSLNRPSELERQGQTLLCTSPTLWCYGLCVLYTVSVFEWQSKYFTVIM